MLGTILANFDLPELPMIAMFIFLLQFIGVVIWVFRSGSKDLYKTINSMPLEKE